MANIQELKSAFMNAHNAGDKAAAQTLADAIRREESLAISKAASDKMDADVAASRVEGGAFQRGIEGVGAGLTDKWLGAKQAVNAVTGGLIGDKDALNAEAREKRRLDAPLKDTTAGSVGSFIGEIAPDLLLGGGAGALVKGGAKMLPAAVTKLTPKIVSAAAPGAIAGAASGVTNPDEDYDIWKQGGIGAAFGVGGDVAARLVGRALNPLQEKLSQTTAEQLAILKPHMKNFVAENLTDKAWVRHMTNALEQVMGPGGYVDKARKGVMGDYTGHVSAGTPAPTRELSPSAREAMQNAKDAAYRALKDEPARVPIVGGDDLNKTLTNTLEQIELTGGSGKAAADRLRASIEKAGGDLAHASGPFTPVGEITIPASKKLISAGDTRIAKSGLSKVPLNPPPPPPPGTPFTALTPTTTANKMIASGAETPAAHSKLAQVFVPEKKVFGATGPARELPTTSVEEAMQAHKTLSRQLKNASPTEEAAIHAQMNALKEGLETALGPEKFAKYMEVQKQHGIMKDLLATVTPDAPFGNPQAMAQRMLGEGKVAKGPLEKFVAASAGRIQAPQKTYNRALMTGLLLGGGGVAGEKFLDDPLKGAGGVAAPVALATALLTTKRGGKYLTGQAEGSVGKFFQSEAFKKRMQLLLSAGAGEAGVD